MRKFQEIPLSVVRSMWFDGVIYQVTMNIPRGSEQSGNGSFLTVYQINPDGSGGELSGEWEMDEQAEAENAARRHDLRAHLEAMEIRYNVS